MNYRSTLAVLAVSLAAASAYAADAKPQQLSPVPSTAVHLEDAFWAPRITLNREKVIPHNFDFCEKTGRITNFDKAAGKMPGNFEGIFFNDSDLYKVIEGAAYSLAQDRDPKLEAYVDSIIDRIAAAQQPDGYLYTFYTVRKELNKRWTNTKDMHEMYCAGHLMEAACAYYQATGKRKLLDVAIKLANYIDSVFGPDKRHAVPGHEEIELALVKLARITGDQKYFKLAQFFINERGHDACGRKLYGDYAQDDVSLRQRTEIAGHAVRAMYFFAGATDVAAATGDQEIIKALDTIWHDVVDRKMYVTGGIGPSAHNEGFTVPYDLPNDSAYAETCAAIGMVLWNHRMALLHADAKYADVMERCMYNGSISGVSLDGQKFFYVNPLASRGKHHRQAWFDCSCCPTNIVRFLPNIGGYMFATGQNAIYANVYAKSRSTLAVGGTKVVLSQETDYPWDGRVKLTIQPEQPATFALNLRIPGWCKQWSLKLNGQENSWNAQNGYVAISREWKNGDVIELNLSMPIERVYADPNVKADIGRVAIQRGPIVYCLEGVDNVGWVRNLVLPKDAKLSAEFRKDLLNGVTVIKGTALAVERGKDNPTPVEFTAVPYYAWDNRESGQMVVWLPEDPKLAEPKPAATLSSEAKVSSSYKWRLDTLDALNDQAEPARSNDQSIPRFTWWDHKGSEEWVQYDFKSPVSVREVEVYWFDDSGSGGCRVPASWKLMYRTGGEWQPVPNASAYTTAADRYNKVGFDPVQAQSLRLVARLQDGASGGILEWKVK